MWSFSSAAVAVLAAQIAAVLRRASKPRTKKRDHGDVGGQHQFLHPLQEDVVSNLPPLLPRRIEGDAERQSVQLRLSTCRTSSAAAMQASTCSRRRIGSVGFEGDAMRLTTIFCFLTVLIVLCLNHHFFKLIKVQLVTLSDCFGMNAVNMQLSLSNFIQYLCSSLAALFQFYLTKCRVSSVCDILCLFVIVASGRVFC